MRVIEAAGLALAPITAYGSSGADSTELAAGAGEGHAHVIRFAPGGEIGPHPTGFAQLFIPVEGSGWVSGADGERVPLRVGEVAFFERGEVHAKGSATGMTVVMVQVRDLELVDR